MPANIVKIWNCVKNNPVSIKATHIPIPPLRGIVTVCELRSLGVSNKPTFKPNREVRAAKNRLKKNDNKEQIINDLSMYNKLMGHRFPQMYTDYYFLKLSYTLRLISGLEPKLNKRPTSISVAFR